jgi:cation transport regulator ChaB
MPYDKISDLPDSVKKKYKKEGNKWVRRKGRS